jgi:hypothetical protein
MNVLINPSQPILDVLQNLGYTFEEPGDIRYFYLPFAFKLTKEGVFTKVDPEELPDYIISTIRKSTP